MIRMIATLMLMCTFAFSAHAQLNFFQNNIEADVKVGDPKQITDSDKHGPLHFRGLTTIFGNHRDTETKVVFWTSGKWRIHFVYSNGNKYDAEDFVTVVRFFDSAGRQIGNPIKVKQLVGATGVGKTKKKTVRMEGMLTPDEYRRFSYYEVTHLTTDRDLGGQLEEGSEFLRSLQEFSTEAAKTYQLYSGSGN